MIMIHGTYAGPNDRLKGKTALLQINDRYFDTDEVMAQFDDVSTGYGYGWWYVPARSFQLDEEENGNW